ncbi:MAG: Rpn family recombination-promoting nuclease/putative transposase [Magnetococcales bacterium]|nr:Rpn family recombination-promoting nuclease/putative transposase [Magnetococcales bacterium]
MGDHDSGYKRLFSHPEMVRDLLLGFVKESWVNEVDLSTLEKASGGYVTDDLRDREDDLIWKIRWKETWLFIYLLIEFQSTVEWFMSVRMDCYTMLLYQDLISSGSIKPGEKLPPVLPVVIYNGKARWSAALDVADLIVQPPGGLEQYRPRMRYLLIDGVRYAKAGLSSQRNLVAALFRLEQCRSTDEIRLVLRDLIDWVKAPEQTSLRRAFTVWLGRVLLPRRIPGQTIPEKSDLQEVDAMLAETVQEWTLQWEEEGRQKGLQEGLKEGLQKGSASLFLCLLENRFGGLPSQVRKKVLNTEQPTLERWSLRLFKANSLEEIFDP